MCAYINICGRLVNGAGCVRASCAREVHIQRIGVANRQLQPFLRFSLWDGRRVLKISRNNTSHI